MHFKKEPLSNSHITTPLMVVIDVIRAFTTTAFAFKAGAKNILLTDSIEEAKLLHKTLPNSLLAGEEMGNQVEGFHFGNSPVEIAQSAVANKTIILRTSAGTQGVIRATHAKELLVASFATAEATVKAILQKQPEEVTFLITGQYMGADEDVALADYLIAKLLDKTTDPAPYLKRVENSHSAQLFSSGFYPQFKKEDLAACLSIDCCDFAMEVYRADGRYNLLKLH